MTNEQRKHASRLMSRYMAFQCQKYEYDWNEDLNGQQAYTQFHDAMKDLNVDFNSLTEVDAYVLGLTEYKAGKVGDIYLIPIHLFNVLPKGTVLYDINGEKVTVGTSYIDKDTRGGYIAYGVKLKK